MKNVRFVFIGALVALLGLSAHAEEQSAVSTAELPGSRPQVDRPWFGIELSGSKSGIGTQTVSTSAAEINYDLVPAALQIDFQPFHSLGVLGIGPSLDYYSTLAHGDDKAQANLRLLWSVGGQVRYQAYFFRDQPIVPMAAYSIQSVSYRVANSASGSFRAEGPSFGMWVYLNMLDRKSASLLRNETGISRSYLTIEWRRLVGQDAQVAMSGQTYHLGLRVEL